MDSTTAKPARLRNARGHYLPYDAAPAETPAATPIVDAPIPAVETIAAPAAPFKEIKTVATNFQDTVKSQTETFAAQGKAAYEQATSRAKEAFEKSQATVAELQSFAKGNVEALVASNKAAVAGFETMAQQSAEFAKASAEKTVAVVKTLAASKSVNEFVTTHNEFARSQFDAFVAEMSKASETALKVLGEVFEPLSNRLALAADKVAKAGAR